MTLHMLADADLVIVSCVAPVVVVPFVHDARACLPTVDARQVHAEGSAERGACVAACLCMYADVNGAVTIHMQLSMRRSMEAAHPVFWVMSKSTLVQVLVAGLP